MRAREIGRQDRIPRLHLLTDDTVLARPSFLDAAALVLGLGGPALGLHVRGPRTPGRSIYDIVTELQPHAGRSGSKLFVNDRVDVALLLGIDGIHLGERSLPPDIVRRLVGRRPLVGMSVHAGAEVGPREREGADYVFGGSLFTTESHPEAVAIGIEGLTELIACADPLPVLGIGGIRPSDVAAVLGAGAHGIAVIRGVWNQTDPGRAALRYLDALGRMPQGKEGKA